MSYKEALEKAWSELEAIANKDIFSIKMLADEYTVNLSDKTVLSLSCNISAKEYLAILILHYLKREIEGMLPLTNEWISFHEFAGSEGYYPTFHKRVIGRLIEKFSDYPEKLLAATERLPAKRTQYSDVGIVVNVFEKLPMMITLWKKDEEFSSNANVLFDRNIKDIYPTEDVVVLAEFVVSQL